LRQTLETDDGAAENVIIEYRLSASHNVWFLTPNGTPVKTLTFQEVVTDEPTPLRHTVKMDATHAGPEMGSVQIDETITEDNGQKRVDLCVVGLL
jgi:hypothetical protein